MATYEIGKVQVDQLTEPAGGPTSSFGDTVTAPGLDAPASNALLIGTTNATGMTIGHTGITINHNAATSIFANIATFNGTTNLSGTTNLTTFTSGSVLFVESGGAITQNNSNFFWDNTNNRLGIATSPGPVRVHIKAPTSGATEQLRLDNPNTGGAYWDISSTDNGWAAGGGKIIFVPNGGGSATAPFWIATNGDTRINISDTSDFAEGLGTYSASQPTGRHIVHRIGQSATTGNAGEFSFYYAGSNNASNAMVFSTYAAGEKMHIMNNGDVALGGTITPGTTTTGAKLIVFNNSQTAQLNSGGFNIGGTATDFPLMIDAQNGNGNSVRIGSTLPIYIKPNWPAIGFNTYWNGTTFALGAGSSSQWGAWIGPEETNGHLEFFVSSTSGNANATPTFNKGLSVFPSGAVGVGGTNATGTPTLYATTSAVGIGSGTTTPSFTLDVSGTGHFSSNLTVGGSLITNSYSDMFEQSVPASPASGYSRLYWNSSDHLAHYKNSSGADHILAANLSITQINDVDHTVTDSDVVIEYIAATSNHALTLPAAANYPGRVIWVRDASGWNDSFSQYLSIQVPGGTTLNGSAGGLNFSDINGSVAFIADGTDWKTLHPDTTNLFASTTTINLSNKHSGSIQPIGVTSGGGAAFAVHGGNTSAAGQNGGHVTLTAGTGGSGGSSGAIGLVGTSGGYISIADGFFGGAVVNIGIGQSGAQLSINANSVIGGSIDSSGSHNRFNPGTTSSEALMLKMTAPGSAGARDSHWLQIQGGSFDTSPHNTDWREYVNVTSNAGASIWRLQSRIDAASFTDRFTIDDGGNATFAGNLFVPIIYGSNITGGTLRLQANSVDSTSGDVVLQNGNLYLEAGGNTSYHATATGLTISSGGNTIINASGSLGGNTTIDPFDATGSLNLCTTNNSAVTIGNTLGVGTTNIMQVTNLKGGFVLGGYGGTPIGDIVTNLHYRSGAFEEWVAGSAPSTPSSGNFRIYWSSGDKLMHYVDSSSVDYAIPSISANANDFQLTTTSATTIATYTPPVQGNYKIDIYYRVVTATTNVTITLTWTDGSGAQTSNIVPLSAMSVGSYIVPPTYINSTAAAITISATSGTANNLYVSASIGGA